MGSKVIALVDDEMLQDEEKEITTWMTGEPSAGKTIVGPGRRAGGSGEGPRVAIEEVFGENVICCFSLFISACKSCILRLVS